MQFDRGYLSPYFVTNPTTMEAVLEDAYILIHEKKISRRQGSGAGAREGGPDGQAAADHRRGGRGRGPGDAGDQQAARHFPCAAVKAPGYGDRRKAMLEDIAVLTGGKPIFEALGIELENVELADLGRAKKVIIDKDNTTIIEGAGSHDAIKGRIEPIRREIADTKSDYDREKLEERLAKLAGGVAKINVGAATESEMKEKKARVEDALHATRAALEEGILPGGGVALLRASGPSSPRASTHDEEIGYKIIVRACAAPLDQIAENAGQDGGVVCLQGRRGQGQLRLRCLHGRVHRPGQGRHHRPDQGHPLRPPERRQRQHAAPDLRRPDRRCAQGRREEAGRRRPWRV